MAELASHSTPEVTSHQTALAIVPPAHLVEHVDTLRAAYDKAYQKWPAHLNLVYPFVHPDSIQTAASLVRSALSKANLKETKLKLSETGYFTHKHSSTVFIRPEDDHELQHIRAAVLAEFHQSATQPYSPHMTIGQASNEELRDSLQAKASLIPSVEWPLKELAILVRGEDNAMKVSRTIRICADDSAEEAFSSLQYLADSPSRGSSVQSGTTYRFDPSSASWTPYGGTAAAPQTMPPLFKVSSYNVLVDSIWPPAFERFELLVQALLHDSARANLVVLQEVSDDFLSHLLRNEAVRKLWPYVSHAPPDQADIGPLLSLRNIVILSRWRFEWKMVPFERRHKGAVVVQLNGIGKITETGAFLPLVIAGLHLTCGLTDGSVAAKKSQLRTLLNHLSMNYPESPWIIAGDFNMTTSSLTIQDAIMTHSISPQTVRTLESLEQLLAEAGLRDAWDACRSHYEPSGDYEDLAVGEEGATFDPSRNPLAAEIVGHGLTHRPQRYDRILLKGEEALEVAGFNMFGRPEGDKKHCGSDHWGVRATIRFVKSPLPRSMRTESIPAVRPPYGLHSGALQNFVESHPSFPTTEETEKRKEVLAILDRTLRPLATADNKIPSISTKIFFTLAVKHLKNAAAQDVRILRKVEAHSGTMLELNIQGIRLDLQYCAAAQIAGCWPAPLSLPPTDPLFSLPLQTLSKLKAIRDLAHLQNTTPDLPAFQMAYRLLVVWARSRGIYAARFGYLSGTHISLMLDRIAKLLYHSNRDVTAADLVCAFFRYYAEFDWSKNTVEDPLARAIPGMGRPYQRHASEPMVVLGYHIPRVNIARAATVPAVGVLTEELQRAHALVTKQPEQGSTPTWAEIIGEERNSAAEFLSAYRSYIRVDVQYWGTSSVKGRQLIGWVESRCPTLLIDLNRKIPEIHARMWPLRFARGASNEKGDQHGCYLVGLAKRQDSDSDSKTEADRKLAQSKLDGVLERFSDQIRGNEKFFDPTSGWVEVSHVSRAKLEELIVDTNDWGNDLEESWEFEDEDEEEDDIDELALLEVVEETAPFISEAPPTVEGSYKTGKKLRPATDIMNRLRWDPSLNSADYVVGYTDRFLGTRETALDRWKVEQTDEEFIPQHRIVYFKRRSDGVKVWDREARLDILSGGG
ncbi:Endonuclease/exonuclease/phosphatase [Macrophomina phaseolina MS6]|uniref:polynucleotide adenylyltransferase n=1 Tax=Macrophomina phaseolina (strain MS6) TaxID=1126212 RepID=K2R0C1_MACPH|nr:Endonuclease/exonuclease/phosphatase [Macrophomina phaseolina MS6]